MKVIANIAKSNKLAEEYSVFLSFEYNPRILDIVRALPNKWWHAEIKQWEAPVKSLPGLLEKIDWLEWEITSDSYIELVTEDNVQLPKEFKFKTSPFQHQIEGVNYGMSHNRWLLGDEQGLGKTKQVIDIAIAKKYQKNYKHCLIICGVNGLKWNWLNEIHVHSDEAGWILGQYHKNTLRGEAWGIGSNQDKLDDLRKIGHDTHIDSHYFLITNVESLRNEEITKEIQKLCADGTIGVVAIDEIHKCKNPNSQQGKAILKVQSEVRIAMTGTPLMNTPMDIYIILKWLGYENHSFYSFRNHYCVMGGFGGYEVLGYKNLPELQAKLEEIMLRRRKQDVLDLPPKTYINEYVEMNEAQKKIYKEVTQEVKDNIDQIAVSPNPLAQLIRLRQATGYPGILSSTVQDSAKIDRMLELVEEAVANDKKVVIFSNWTQMTDVIYEELRGRGYGLGVITGDTPDNRRQDIVNRFQNCTDPMESISVLIGTIGAMGTGLTLTAGTVEIFMDEPWNKALKDQAEDRCHRVGTTQNVTIYTLLCKDTIDERINDIVNEKGEMSDAIVDGQIKMDKAQLLDYLLS